MLGFQCLSNNCTHFPLNLKFYSKVTKIFVIFLFREEKQFSPMSVKIVKQWEIWDTIDASLMNMSPN